MGLSETNSLTLIRVLNFSTFSMLRMGVIVQCVHKKTLKSTFMLRSFAIQAIVPVGLCNAITYILNIKHACSLNCHFVNKICFCSYCLDMIERGAAA